MLTTYALKALKTPRIPENSCQILFPYTPHPCNSLSRIPEGSLLGQVPKEPGDPPGKYLLPLRPSTAPGTAGIRAASGPREYSLTWGAQSSPRTSRAVTGRLQGSVALIPRPAGARMVLGRMGGRGALVFAERARAFPGKAGPARGSSGPEWIPGSTPKAEPGTGWGAGSSPGSAGGRVRDTGLQVKPLFGGEARIGPAGGIQREASQPRTLSI